MKKYILIFIILPIAILGCLGSCHPADSCYEVRLFMTPTPYCDTCYNCVRAITYKYLSNPIARDEVYGPYLEEQIFSEDSTVLDTEIRVYGRLCDLYTLEDTKYTGANPLANRINISYDTSDHAIYEKLKGILDAHDHDTVYIKGNLRLYMADWQENEMYYNCSYMMPGIFIYSADDITIAQKQDEDN